MEDSTTKEFTDVILSLKKETLTMASQCLEIQRELSTILTAITFPKEAEEGNLKKSNEKDGFADAENGQINWNLMEFAKYLKIQKRYAIIFSKNYKFDMK